MAGTCKVEGCQGKSHARGLCRAHYARWANHGDPGKAEIRPRGKREGPCSVPGCGEVIYARGYCLNHWRRWHQHGDPVITPKDQRAKSRYRAIARRLKAKGMPYSELADVMGVSRQRVQQLVGMTAEENEFWRDALGHKCHFCKASSSNGKLDLHHLEYADGKMKVILLCTSCHRKLEGLRLCLPEASTAAAIAKVTEEA